MIKRQKIAVGALLIYWAPQRKNSPMPSA